MKDLVKTILERGGDDETVTMPKWCDIVKISPNDFDGSVSFLKIADIKEDKSLEEVLAKLKELGLQLNPSDEA